MNALVHTCHRSPTTDLDGPVEEHLEGGLLHIAGAVKRVALDGGAASHFDFGFWGGGEGGKGDA